MGRALLVGVLSAVAAWRGVSRTEDASNRWVVGNAVHCEDQSVTLNPGWLSGGIDHEGGKGTAFRAVDS